MPPPLGFLDHTRRPCWPPEWPAGAFVFPLPSPSFRLGRLRPHGAAAVTRSPVCCGAATMGEVREEHGREMHGREITRWDDGPCGWLNSGFSWQRRRGP